MNTAELQGQTFACIEGCGFCCTFPPAVSHTELARLRSKFPTLPIARGAEGGLRLALQGGCGGCTLLARRRCTSYGERPAHCRYFPFHLYFGRRVEAYVNRTCRGVEASPGGNLSGAFAAQVLGVASQAQIAEKEREARRVHQRFEREAKAAGSWGDVDAATARLLADPAAVDALATQEAAVQDAWALFEAPEAVSRPFHLTADLRWLTFEGKRVLEMEETGEMREVGRLALAPNAPEDAGVVLAELRRFAGRDLWAGSVYALVDEAEHALSVEEAVGVRVAAVGAELRLRLQVLRALGLPTTQEELSRFADSPFLDSDTIGGWL